MKQKVRCYDVTEITKQIVLLYWVGYKKLESYIKLPISYTEQSKIDYTKKTVAIFNLTKTKGSDPANQL